MEKGQKSKQKWTKMVRKENENLSPRKGRKLKECKEEISLGGNPVELAGMTQDLGAEKVAHEKTWKITKQEKKKKAGKSRNKKKLKFGSEPER